MSRTPFKAKLTLIRQITPTMKELQLQILGGAKMKFEAGQFVMLQVPPEEVNSSDGKAIQRAYSLASSSERADGFNLIFKILPGGIASTYVDKMRGDEILNFTGPWGKCTFKQPVSKHVIFASTSSGLSQHYSYLVSDAPKHPDTQFTMLVGVYREEEMFYIKEIEEAAKHVPNFKIHWCLSEPSPQWKGFKGRITDFSRQMTIDPQNTHVYLCGSSAMIKDMKQIFLEEKGLAKDHLCLENFG